MTVRIATPPRAGSPAGAAPAASPPTFVERQARRPGGGLGRLTGRVLALVNRDINRWAVERLAPSPDDRVLEIGCGPGVGLGLLASRLPRGIAIGVDLSPAMIAQARARNRRAVRAQRVLLWRGSALSLPYRDAAFTNALAVESLFALGDPVWGLVETRRVLRKGAELGVCLRCAPIPRRPWLPRGHPETALDRVVGFLRTAGFREIGTERPAARPGYVYFRARR